MEPGVNVVTAIMRLEYSQRTSKRERERGTKKERERGRVERRDHGILGVCDSVKEAKDKIVLKLSQTGS